MLLKHRDHNGSERGLRSVREEGRCLAVEDRGDVELERPRQGQGARAAGDEKVRGLVKEALRLEGRSECGEALLAPGPVEGRSGSGRDAGVVGVSVGGAVHAEGEHHVRLEAAHALEDRFDESGKRCVLELAVLKIEQFVMRDAEDFAGGGELFAADAAKFFIRFCAAAIAPGRAFGQAERVDFDTAVGGEGQRATEGETFVVRMGEDTEEAEGHRGDVRYEM